MTRKIVICPHADGSGWSWADVPTVETADDPVVRRHETTRAQALAARRCAARYTDAQIVDAFPPDYTAQDHRTVCEQPVPATTVEIRRMAADGLTWYEVWHNNIRIGSAGTEPDAIAQARAAWRVEP